MNELESFLQKQIEHKDRLIAEQSATISRLVKLLSDDGQEEASGEPSGYLNGRDGG